MPDFEKKEAVVKLNTAAVLREGHHLKVREAEEAKVLKDYEMNLRDDEEFNRWKKEMNEKDDIERLEHIAKKKIEMELAREEAIQAQKNKFKENKINAEKMKVQRDQREEIRAEEKREDREKRAAIVETIHEQKDNAMIEMEKVKQKNREVRDEINKEITEMMQRKKMEDEIEQRKKEELIRQIRELEKIPIVRTKGYDPTETGGHGLLEEMCVAELRERLEFNKRQREIETEEKRTEILNEKEHFISKMMDESDKIQKDREQRKKVNDERRLLKK